MNSSPAAAIEPRNHSTRFVRRAAGFLVAAFLVVLGARFLINDAIPFLTDISPHKFGRFWPRRAWLLTHISGSGIALLIGPFQFWSGLRRRSMLVHHWTGRLYVVGVLIGGSAAFYLASHAGQGATFGISLGIWVGGTVQAGKQFGGNFSTGIRLQAQRISQDVSSGFRHVPILRRGSPANNRLQPSAAGAIVSRRG